MTQVRAIQRKPSFGVFCSLFGSRYQSSVGIESSDDEDLFDGRPKAERSKALCERSTEGLHLCIRFNSDLHPNMF